MRLWTNHVDTTSDHIAMLKRTIATNEQLLEQYDPDNLTTDGNIEISDVTPRESAGVLPGRWVSYRLDDRGRAFDLQLFDIEHSARNYARHHGRAVGVIGEDMWSISPEPTWTAHALIQKMPSGWWKALIADWPDLPEQYGLSRDNVIDEIGRVAREYLEDRTAQGVRIPVSRPASYAGWECVSVSIEF